MEITVIDEFQGFDFSRGNPPLELAENAVRDIGLAPSRSSTGGGSDVNVLNLLGLPCVNMSIGMEKVHTPDEFITVESLTNIQRLIMALVERAREK